MNIKIAHVAVYATDIEKTKDYYANYFSGRSNALYRNDKGFSSYFITFEGGVSLEIMQHEELKLRPVLDKTNGWSHIAFSVGDRETVRRLTEQIVSDGYQLYSPPRQTGDGYYESCVADPDGNRVEITE
jgi:lactoylglutathione lyase